MEKETAYFAAGCFWGVQYRFDQIPGVVETEVGYMGGDLPNPTYAQVCSGTTGHAETVKVVFDPQQLDYAYLLDQFFRMHDPTQLNRQGPDIGSQYRSAIFYTSTLQKTLAEQAITHWSQRFSRPIVTQLCPADDYPFWPAEAAHQKYFARRGIRGGCHG
ncbi:MAG TPA: peptide-methionine (S)-S-oxide reductase [Sulfurivirga caldicuralii]|nr:peptide-methionine (S)-S-oxide reductase [Sulfurivirga caldicuralii]